MKTINIEIPSGHEIDQENSNLSEGKIVFREVKKTLTKTWEELGIISGYYVNSNSKIELYCFKTQQINRNVFATKELAEASIALAQLSQLREEYRQGWKPDWKNYDQKKYIIRSEDSFLSFKSAEIRDEFLNNFRDLIETAKPLMS